MKKSLFVFRSSSANTPSSVKRKKKRKKLHHIGFAVYEVPPHMTRLTPIYVAEHVSDSHSDCVWSTFCWVPAEKGCVKCERGGQTDAGSSNLF